MDGIEKMAREIENQDELGILPLNKEIMKHLRKLKTHKAPGMNGVPTECYKLLGMGGGFSNAGHHFYVLFENIGGTRNLTFRNSTRCNW